MTTTTQQVLLDALLGAGIGGLGGGTYGYVKDDSVDSALQAALIGSLIGGGSAASTTLLNSLFAKKPTVTAAPRRRRTTVPAVVQQFEVPPEYAGRGFMRTGPQDGSGPGVYAMLRQAALLADILDYINE